MSTAADRPLVARQPLPASLAAALGGNRCGHSPSAPRFELVTLPADANHARPALIGKAQAQLQRYYRSPHEGRWDVLSQGERRQRLERQLQAVGGAETDAGRQLLQRLARWRQQRSERREALVAVLLLLLAYTDIATLTVAVPRGPDWLGLSAPWIAQHTGLSLSRVKRALATLARTALLINTGRGRQFDRRRRCWVGSGWGPVRRFSFRLVRALGLEVSWAQARRQARKRARAAATPAAPAASMSMAPPLVNPVPAPALGTAAPVPAPRPEHRAAQRAHARALRQQLTGHPPPTDPATRQADLDRNRRIAELAAQGCTRAEIRQRLNDAAQPP